MGTRNHVLDGGQDQTNLFAAARGDKSAFRQNYLPIYSVANLLFVIFILVSRGSLISMAAHQF